MKLMHRIIAVTDRTGQFYKLDGRWIFADTFFRMLIMRGFTHYAVRSGSGTIKIPGR